MITSLARSAIHRRVVAVALAAARSVIVGVYTSDGRCPVSATRSRDVVTSPNPVTAKSCPIPSARVANPHDTASYRARKPTPADLTHATTPGAPATRAGFAVATFHAGSPEEYIEEFA